VDDALVRLMVWNAENAEDEDDIVTKTARLPGTVPLAEANLEIALMVKAAGGKVMKATESRSRTDAPGTLTMSIGDGEETCCRVVVSESRQKVAPAKPGMFAIVVNTGDLVDLQLLSELLKIETEVGILILPYRERSTSAYQMAQAQASDVLAGIPMEPAGGAARDWGEGSLLSSMNNEELRAVLKADLEAVPDAKGAVLFLDSPLVHDSGALKQIVREIGTTGMFLIDATLTPYSGVPNACRREKADMLSTVIHLNPGGRETVTEISERIQSLARLSRRHGKVVGICDLTPALLVALKRESPKLEESGVKLMKPSALLGGQD